MKDHETQENAAPGGTSAADCSIPFDAAYGRTGIITVETAVCHKCDTEKPCISIDSSDDEYGPGYICLSCATDMVAHYESNTRIADSGGANAIKAKGEAAAAANSPTELLRLAVETGADVERLGKLMELQERYEANAARKAFYSAMAQFQAECPPIPKPRQVTDRGGKRMYSYAPLETILDTIRATEARHGFRHSWDHEERESGVRIVCTISHRDGHAESSRVDIPATKGMNTNAAQDRGIEITYGQRRSLLNGYGLAVGGEDTDGQTIDEAPPPLTKPHLTTIKALIADSKTDEGRLLEYVGAATIESIPDSRFAEIEHLLLTKRRQA